MSDLARVLWPGHSTNDIPGMLPTGPPTYPKTTGFGAPKFFLLRARPVGVPVWDFSSRWWIYEDGEPPPDPQVT